MDLNEAWRNDDEHVFLYVTSDAALWLRLFGDFAAIPSDVREHLGELQFTAAVSIQQMPEMPIVLTHILNLEELFRDGYAVTHRPTDWPFEVTAITRPTRGDH